MVFPYFSFNPRAREGRDEPEDDFENLTNVSIHAPARGATNIEITDSADAGFNPRAREGRD